MNLRSIILVKTPVPELLDDRLDPPMGLLYLGTVLKRAGFHVEILDLSGIPEEDWKFPEAEAYGFSTYTASYNRTVRIKNQVKKLYPNVVTIAGGPHATALSDEVATEFDHVIVDEGETALLELMVGVNRESIITGKPMDVERIPIPDYSLVDVESYNRRYLDRPSFQIFTSRGCPYRCGFCSKLPHGHVLRRRSVENVVYEIELIRNNEEIMGRPAPSFRLKDDLFASNGRWLADFANMAVGIEYSCNVRADYGPEIPELLAATGCKTACMGIESGSDAVLKCMNKRTTRQQNIDAIRGLQDVGIEVLAWIVIGYPGETWETFYETISLLGEAQPDIVRAYPLIPYPGTPVYDQVEILDSNWDHYFYIQGNNDAGFVYQTPELPRGEIMGMWANLNRYLKNYRTCVEVS